MSAMSGLPTETRAAGPFSAHDLRLEQRHDAAPGRPCLRPGAAGRRGPAMRHRITIPMCRTIPFFLAFMTIFLFSSDLHRSALVFVWSTFVPRITVTLLSSVTALGGAGRLTTIGAGIGCGLRFRRGLRLGSSGLRNAAGSPLPPAWTRISACFGRHFQRYRADDYGLVLFGRRRLVDRQDLDVVA